MIIQLDGLLIFPDWSMRTTVTSNLACRLMSHGILYIRGTPASGKTVLLNLLHQELLTQHPSLRVISIKSWPQSMNDFQSQGYIEWLLGASLSNPSVIPPTVLLVDEAQLTKEDQYFWNTFLKLVVQPASSTLRVAMFAAYGSAGNSPVDIPCITPPILRRIQRVELQWHGNDEDPPVGLFLSREEAEEIFDKATAHHQDRPSFNTDFRTYVYDVTSGHVGALTSVIEGVTKNRVCIINIHLAQEVTNDSRYRI